MTLPQLAKNTLETYIKKGEIISLPSELPKHFLKKRNGVFVTIENSNALRGCIGTYLPTKENIAMEIISNTISAGTKDYRFEPITEKELSYLSYTIYILKKPEKIGIFDNIFSQSIKTKLKQKLNPKKYGIIIKSGFKTGLLLPDLKNVDTIEKQILIASEKAGINLTKNSVKIFRFDVQKYTE